MGTIKQGILGGFSGKVGTVIGSSWNGVSYMRAQAQSIKNPRTEAQMEQRTKFALTIAFLKPIVGYIRTGYKTYANGRTTYNAAMSYIVKNCIAGEYPDYTVDYEQALVARGSLQPASGAQATIADGTINLTWTDNSGMGDALTTDMAMPLVINPQKSEAVYSTAAASRSAEALELTLPPNWEGDTVIAYLAFISLDGDSVSNSTYLGELTVA